MSFRQGAVVRASSFAGGSSQPRYGYSTNRTMMSDRIQGYVRIIRYQNTLHTLWKRSTGLVESFVTIDGELMTTQESNISPIKKRYTLTGANIEYNASKKHPKDFSVTIGRKVLLFFFESVPETERWAEIILRASQRTFDRFYNQGQYLRTETYGAKTYICYDSERPELEFDVTVVEDDDAAVDAIRKASVVLNSPCILGLVDTFRNARVTHLVRRKLDGTSVRTLIDSNNRRSHPEENAFIVAYETLCAIDHMHSKHIAHRDIRPEHILITRTKKILVTSLDRCAKYSHENVDDNVFEDVHATAGYQAPEIRAGRPYGPKADIWAIGAIVYEVITGKIPPESRKASIWDGEQDTISKNAKLFIQQCLCRSTSKRPSAMALLQHTWIQNGLVNNPALRCNIAMSFAPIVEHTPMMKSIEEQGLAETKKADPVKFHKVTSDLRFKSRLNIILTFRRKILIQSRGIIAVLRLLKGLNELKRKNSRRRKRRMLRRSESAINMNMNMNSVYGTSTVGLSTVGEAEESDMELPKLENNNNINHESEDPDADTPRSPVDYLKALKKKTSKRKTKKRTMSKDAIDLKHE